MENDKDGLIEELGKFIYPEVKIQRDEHRIKLSTSLRKEHNGEWYYWEFTNYTTYNKITLDDIEFQLQNFHRDVYRVIVEGIVNPELREAGKYGELIFKKTISQLSEKERLKLKYQPAFFSTENMPQIEKFLEREEKMYPTKESVLRSAKYDDLI